MTRLVDITGMRFGRLIAVEQAPTKGGQTRWICKCDCGSTKEIRSAHLREGLTKSCGCLENENRQNQSSRRSLDLSGARSGLLTYLQEAEPRKAPDGRHVRRILCVCACGNKKELTAAVFMEGKSKSCGCLSSLLTKQRGKLLAERNKNERR